MGVGLHRLGPTLKSPDGHSVKDGIRVAEHVLAIERLQISI